VRSARNLTELEVHQAQESFEHSKAQNLQPGTSRFALTKRRFAEVQAADSLNPQLWNYEEKSINPINLDSDLVVAPDLRLPRRKSRNGEFARVLTGLEQSGASSSDSAQKYFFDFYLSMPAPFQSAATWEASTFGPRYRIWGDARITTVPQQITSSLGEFAVSFSEQPQGRFPATLDAVFGQNETVTGGKLRGAVARIDGFYPFPFDSLKFMYLFGTADLLVGGRKSQNTILLQQATNPPAIPDPSIFLLSTPQLSRDHYRLAVGIDLLQLYSSIKNSSDNKPQKPAPKQSGGAAGQPQPNQ